MSKKGFLLRCVAPTMLLLLIVVSVLTFRYLNTMSLQQIKAYMDSLGVIASVAYIAMCILRGIVFLPCGLLSALGGILFGPLLGTVYALVGLTAGSVLTFYLARGLGKGWAQSFLGHKYDKYEGYVSKDSFYSIFLMRAVPLLPFDAVSCIAGMSRAGVGKFILATFIGSLPGVSIYVFFGDSVRSLSIRRMILSLLLTVTFALVPLLYKKLKKLIHKTA